MRIGINSLFLIPGKVGGTETALRNLVRKLQEIDRENDYVLYTNRENAGTFELHQENFREVRCPLRATSRPSRIAWEQLLLPLQALRDRLDVLHSPGYTAPLMLPCASVVTIHDLNYHFFPEDWSTSALWANRFLIPWVARRSTRVITDSRSSQHDIAELLGVAAAKLDVIHLGSTVEVETDGDHAIYVIVGSTEAKPASGRLSNESPVGRALIGAREGDEVTVELPTGSTTYRVIAIH